MKLICPQQLPFWFSGETPKCQDSRVGGAVGKGHRFDIGRRTIWSWGESQQLQWQESLSENGRWRQRSQSFMDFGSWSSTFCSKTKQILLASFFEHTHLHTKLFIWLLNFKKILFNGSDYDLCDGSCLSIATAMGSYGPSQTSHELQVHHQLLRVC